MVARTAFHRLHGGPYVGMPTRRFKWGQLSSLLLGAEAFISDMRRPGALGETPDLIVIGTFEGGRPTFSETCRACFARELIHGVPNGSLLPERN
ncbi:hypothetical protein BN77_1111 [Rhizobium mesoamericanum STM3625]|uniref:Uncharacterized protein n=1 Tax=Rhizobium mesoamericanum STM3625 TaxID=1211777 RepID=K0PWE0_9HYPH|nr:hypothetical protein BN77_1111 [Rhizobium mesoamericanum STM3625]